MNFYSDIFLPLCVSKGKKPSRVAQELGFSKSIVSNWKLRGTAPSDTTLVKMAQYFDVELSVLKGEKEQPTENDGLSEVKKMLTGMIPQMSDDTASMLLILAKQLTAQGQSKDSLQ